MLNSIFTYPVTIREYHLDTLGHVNNAAYLQILEDVRWEFLETRGLGLAEIHRTGLGPTILEMQLKFSKELRLRQKVTVTLETLSYRKKIGQLHQQILNEKNEICFDATITMGIFSLSERKLVLPTAEWQRALGLNE